jgi:uncharacterized protein YcfJ
MNKTLKLALGAGALALAAQACAQITFYEGEGFRGRAFTTDGGVPNFQRHGFNDLASSVVVASGSWEVCEDADNRGRCVVLRQGSYDTLQGLNMNNRISSVRPVDSAWQHPNEVLAPMAEPNYAYRRRANEQVFDARVTSVHAVLGAPDQRCWVERQVVAEPQRNVGGAIVGGLLGGSIGHQIGGGFGRDLATAGGAVTGAVVGSKAGTRGGTEEREVRRCEAVSNAPPAYWDVDYEFRGQTHRAQMSAAPGPTILVNVLGEPRQ